MNKLFWLVAFLVGAMLTMAVYSRWQMFEPVERPEAQERNFYRHLWVNQPEDGPDELLFFDMERECWRQLIPEEECASERRKVIGIQLREEVNVSK